MEPGPKTGVGKRGGMFRNLLGAVVFTGLVGKCGHVCHVRHSNPINPAIN